MRKMITVIEVWRY